MKQPYKHSLMLVVILLFTGSALMAQNSAINYETKKLTTMKTYLIEREIPNAGKLTAEELRAASQKSCAVLKEIGPRIEWVQSYVQGNKLTCVYRAENEELIREHARKSGFPANSISEVVTVISPATAN